MKNEDYIPDKCNKLVVSNRYTILLFVMAMITFPLRVVAYDIYTGGVYYNLNKEGHTAEVTYMTYSSKYSDTSNSKAYSGYVKIPSRIIGYDEEPYDVISIGEYAFKNCSDLASVSIPSGVAYIGHGAFQGCGGLSTITLPAGLEYIGVNAFIECNGLTNISILDGVVVIGASAFEACSSLQSVETPGSVNTIGDAAFMGCGSLRTISSLGGITAIGRDVFRGCISLSSIHIPEQLTCIGYRAFEGCSGLASVNIPDDVTSIEEAAFNGCSNLTSIVIPADIDVVKSKVFANCTSLKDVYCKIAEPPTTAMDAFDGIELSEVTFHVENSALSEYRTYSPWSLFGSIVELGIEAGIAHKCATPTITYKKGKLTFNCATEGVEYMSEVTVADAKKYYETEVPLLGVYHVTAYAMKPGYDNSDVATADFVIKGSTVTLVGDVNNDNKVDATDISRLIEIILKKM